MNTTTSDDHSRSTDKRDGRVFGIPRHRRLPWDLLYFNKSVPLCAHDRMLNLAEISEARSNLEHRVSWPAIFIKAFALVSIEFPELRQTWYRWPWAHLYQHPESFATMTVQREYDGVPWVFWGRIKTPESLSLWDIQKRIDEFQQLPPEQIFRRDIQFASLPTLMRRMIWTWNLLVSKSGRARRFGTFILTTLAGRGVEIQSPPSVQTCCLTYGPLNECSLSRVTLAYDHRVMDGGLVADALIRLEVIISQTLLGELLNSR